MGPPLTAASCKVALFVQERFKRTPSEVLRRGRFLGLFHSWTNSKRIKLWKPRTRSNCIRFADYRNLVDPGYSRARCRDQQQSVPFFISEHS